MVVDMDPPHQDPNISSNRNGTIGFEGVEKRLEIAFCPAIDSMVAMPDGLRAMKQQEIRALLKLAECTVVAELHNDVFNSYVLSESSLFIYPHRIILKTCGKTQLLKCISLLLSFAAKLSLEPCFCKYSHATFIFPSEQPYPYTSFTEEVKHLDVFFGHMGSEARKIGDGTQNWYIYSASTQSYAEKSTLFNDPVYTVEMCMRDLDKCYTSNFFNPRGEKDGLQMTKNSGIDLLLPNAQISDYAFSPCGYSMNAMESAALSTIHITPEESHSYASFEIMGYKPNALNLQHLVNHALSLFKPMNLVISVHASNCGHEASDHSWTSCSVLPDGYDCGFSETRTMPGRSVVTIHSFQRKGPNLQTPWPLFPRLPMMQSEKRDAESTTEETCSNLLCVAEVNESRKRPTRARKGNGLFKPRKVKEGVRWCSDFEALSAGDSDSSLASNLASSEEEEEDEREEEDDEP